MLYGNAMIAFHRQDGTFCLEKGTLVGYEKFFHRKFNITAKQESIVYWSEEQKRMEKIYDRKPDGVESYCINQVKIYLTMNMINKGIPYFPTPANFFDEEVMELLEAKFEC